MELIARTFSNQRTSGEIYGMFESINYDPDISAQGTDQGIVEPLHTDVDYDYPETLSQKLFKEDAPSLDEKKRKAALDEKRRKTYNFIAFLQEIYNKDKILDLMDFLFSGESKKPEELKSYLQEIIPEFLKRVNEKTVEEYFHLLLSLEKKDALRIIVGAECEDVEEARWISTHQCQKQDVVDIFADEHFFKTCMMVLERCEPASLEEKSFLFKLGFALLNNENEGENYAILFIEDNHPVEEFKLELANKLIASNPNLLRHFENLLTLDKNSPDEDQKIDPTAIDIITSIYNQLSNEGQKRQFIGRMLDIACKIYGEEITSCEFETIPAEDGFPMRQVPMFDEQHPDLFFCQTFLLIEMKRLGLEREAKNESPTQENPAAMEDSTASNSTSNPQEEQNSASSNAGAGTPNEGAPSSNPGKPKTTKESQFCNTM